MKHLIEAEVERSVQEHLTQTINSQKLPDGKAPGNTLIFGFLRPFVDRLKGKAKEIKESGIVGKYWHSKSKLDGFSCILFVIVV